MFWKLHWRVIFLTFLSILFCPCEDNKMILEEVAFPCGYIKKKVILDRVLGKLCWLTNRGSEIINIILIEVSSEFFT